MVRASGNALRTTQRTTPERSITNDARSAAPKVSLKTPYDVDTAPCGQKSESIECWRPSRSANSRNVGTVSQEIAKTTAPAAWSDGSSSRNAVISPVQTPVKANG